MHIQLRIQKESFNKEMGFSPFFYIYNLTKKKMQTLIRVRLHFPLKTQFFQVSYINYIAKFYL